MKNQPKTADQVDNIYVQINDWQNRRKMRIEPEKVFLQVTTSHGYEECEICSQRITAFKAILAQRPDVWHTWRTQDKAYWLVIAKKRNQDGLDRVKEVLNLQRVVRARG